MPVYKGRRAGTWRVTVWTRVGQREWIVEGSRKDARRFERQEQGKASERVARRAPTFSDFSIDLYEPHAKAQLGASTWKRARRYVVMRLVRHFGATRLDVLQPTQVERFKQARLSEGIKTSSINAELRAFKAMLRWAGEDMKLPVAKLRVKMLPEDGRRRVKAWTSEEVAKLLAVIWDRSPHLHPLVRFMLNTGVRKGEAVAAEWSWVDERASLLRIPVNEHWKPKDKEPREVPIDAVLPMLLALPRSSPSVFLSALGTPYAEFPQKTFAACVAEAGLTGGPHCTRHTFASHFLQAIPDLGLLAEVLGHSRIRVTMMYAHMLPGHMQRARGAVNL